MRTILRSIRKTPYGTDDPFGIVGPSERVAERLVELVGLGLDHVVIVGHSRNTPPEIFAESSRRMCAEVIPAVRKGLA